jgi:hypothetical protein
VGSGSKWNADIKIDKAQHRRDILGFRTTSRPNHEVKKPVEDARRADRRDRRAAKAAESSSLCASILIASAISAAGLASNVARVKGWV